MSVSPLVILPSVKNVNKNSIIPSSYDFSVISLIDE